MSHDDRKLWILLGHAPLTPVPPFFAAKVMRQIAAPQAKQPAWFAAALRWLAPAAIATLVLLAVVPQHPDSTVASPELTTLDLVEMISPEDYEVLTQAGWPFNNGFLSANL